MRSSSATHFFILLITLSESKRFVSFWILLASGTIVGYSIFIILLTVSANHRNSGLYIQSRNFEMKVAKKRSKLQAYMDLTIKDKCNLQYVGSTSTEFKVRFRNHKTNMLKNKRTCELSIHFNNSEHEISQINFIIIEQFRSFENFLHLEQLLLAREAYFLRNYLPLILMVLIKGGDLDRNTALITTIE